MRTGCRGVERVLRCGMGRRRWLSLCRRLSSGCDAASWVAGCGFRPFAGQLWCSGKKTSPAMKAGDGRMVLFRRAVVPPRGSLWSRGSVRALPCRLPTTAPCPDTAMPAGSECVLPDGDGPDRLRRQRARVQLSSVPVCGALFCAILRDAVCLHGVLRASSADALPLSAWARSVPEGRLLPRAASQIRSSRIRGRCPAIADRRRRPGTRRCGACGCQRRFSLASMHSVAWGTFISRSRGMSVPVVLQMP